MGYIVLGGVLLFLAIGIWFVPIPAAFTKIKHFASGVLALGAVLFSVLTSFGYNDSGYCQHIRTIFGTESRKCTTGWYFQGWGNVTGWPHYITVTHTPLADAEGSSVSKPYSVRLADNWNGDITQTTRFGIPQDEPQFLQMARDFRSPQRLITTTLRPAITASLDSVANLFTMEEYYAGGKRDQFKTEFKDAVVKGRAHVEQIDVNYEGEEIHRKVAPSNQPEAQDTAETGDTTVRKVKMQKVLDDKGLAIREKHGYVSYGIIVSSAILENLDPDDKFEKQIQSRKDAASRRIVAREERLEQEEQRLLAIASGETKIAAQQAGARVTQIQKTTDAETAKKLVLITADQKKEEAQISLLTTKVRLEEAQVEAKRIKTLADAEAHKKRVLLEADGALNPKLEAWTEAQRYWADAFSKRKVPATVFETGSSGKSSGGSQALVNFMNMQMMKAAKDLSVDTTIKK